jgi:hypothetical protein
MLLLLCKLEREKRSEREKRDRMVPGEVLLNYFTGICLIVVVPGNNCSLSGEEEVELDLWVTIEGRKLSAELQLGCWGAGLGLVSTQKSSEFFCPKFQLQNLQIKIKSFVS